jgi:hypothetical protein
LQLHIHLIHTQGKYFDLPDEFGDGSRLSWTTVNTIALFDGITPDRNGDTNDFTKATHLLYELAESGDVLSFDGDGLNINKEGYGFTRTEHKTASGKCVVFSTYGRYGTGKYFSNIF